MPKSDKKFRIHVSGAAEAFSREEIEEARKNQKLLQLDIKLSMKCSGRCIYCYADAGQKKPNELRKEDVFGIIDQAKTLGAEAVNLTGGEILECPHFFDVAEYAKSKKMVVMAFTNGMGISKDVAEHMMDLELSPCVKLDSINPQTQDKLFGVKGASKGMMQGIQNLINVGYTTDLPALSVNAVITTLNIHEIPETWTWAMDRGINPHATTIQLMGRATNRTDLQIPAQKFYELLTTLSKIDKDYGVEWEPKTPWVRNRACKRHKIGCLVTADGFVQPCSGIPIKFGDLRKNTLKDILTSEQFLEWRKIDQKLEGACGICEHNKDCYGCRSQAYCQTGNVYAEEPMCWRSTTQIT